MNKTQLVDAIATRTELPKTVVSRTLESCFAIIAESMAEGAEVAITNFGRFYPKIRAARTGRNPRTGDLLQIPETSVPVFVAGKALKEAVVTGQTELEAESV